MTDPYRDCYLDGMAAAIDILRRIQPDEEPPTIITDHPRPDSVWAEHVGFVRLPDPTD